MSDLPELGTPIPLATISNATGEIQSTIIPSASLAPRADEAIGALDEFSRLVVLPLSLWAAGLSAWLRILQAQSSLAAR